MRLCFLGDAGSIHLQRWLNYFVQAGHEVNVISFRPSPIQGVREHLLAGGKSGRLAYIQGMANICRLLREIKPDLLHAHYATSFGLLALVSGFHPLVVSAWGSDVLVAPQESFLLKKVVQRVLKAADALTSDSAYMSERIKELLEGEAKELKTVTMGVPQAWVANIPPKEKNPYQILSLRGHHPIYNIDIILKAFARVVQAVPGARLIVAGEGPETPRLKELARGLNIMDQVRFVGQLPHEEVQHYLTESQISVSVPTSDATAVSLLETMACGALPVVSDLPANREWVEENVNGLLVKPQDEESLAAALIRAMQDQALRGRAVQINREKIAKKAIWENNMAEIEELYRTLVQPGTARNGR